MESFETTTMSSRGQIVIPQGVREALDLESGAKFVVLGEGDTIILKKIKVPSTDELKALLSKSRSAAKKGKLKKAEAKKIVEEERKRR